jgi:hypothetical protein
MTKQEKEAFLLGFSIGVIVLSFAFASVIGIERNHYEKRIQQIEVQSKK